MIVADDAGAIKGISVTYPEKGDIKGFPEKYWRSVTGMAPRYSEVVTIGPGGGRSLEAKISDPAYYGRWVIKDGTGSYYLHQLKP